MFGANGSADYVIKRMRFSQKDHLAHSEILVSFQGQFGYFKAVPTYREEIAKNMKSHTFNSVFDTQSQLLSNVTEDGENDSDESLINDVIN